LSSRSGSAARDETGPQGPVLFALVVFIVAFAPAIRGGNRPLPLAKSLVESFIQRIERERRFDRAHPLELSFAL